MEMKRVPELKSLDCSIPKEKLIEIGFMAKRNPKTGEFYDRTYTIYQEATPELIERKAMFDEMVVNEVADMLEELMDIKVQKMVIPLYECDNKKF